MEEWSQYRKTENFWALTKGGEVGGTFLRIGMGNCDT